MSRIVIGVHGLGNKPRKKLLEKWWKLAMKEGLQRKGVYFLPFKFKMVYWADLVFDKPLDEKESDTDSTYYLKEKYSSREYVPKHEWTYFRKKVLDVVEWQLDKIFLNKDLSINYSEISDKIIKKYFRELEMYYVEDVVDKKDRKRKAKDLFREPLTRSLKANRKNKLFLIGHSMGSIIAYDVMTVNAPKVPIDTFVTIGSPLGVPVVMSKNAVERKLSGGTQSKLTTPESVKNNWFNFSDLEDTICANYDLNDDYAPNSKDVAPIDFEINNDYEIDGEENPHKSYGYLRTPEFAEKLYEFLLDGRSGLYKSFIKIINKLFSVIHI